jgi:signal transduction histidine kinase/ligand-binding sensor domain-containing protein
MKCNLIPRTILLWIVCCTFTLRVGAERLPIKTYTSADGLGSSFISSMIRDSRGFLWICTRDGLSRFDGARFVTYQVGDKNAPPGIQQILESSKGVYWIATTSGLYRFDPGRGPLAGSPPGVEEAQVAMVEMKSTDRPILNAEYVGATPEVLYEDRHGNLWTGGDGLYRLDQHGRQLIPQKIDLNLPASAAAFGVAAICEGRDGSFWLATPVGGLVRHLPDGRDVFYPTGPPQRDGLVSVLEDPEGRIWCAGANGLFVLKPESIEAAAGPIKARHINALRHERTAPGGEVRLPAQPGEMVEYSGMAETTSGHPRQLSQTANGEIWFSYASIVIEFDGHSFQLHTTAQGFIEGIERIVEDDSGNLWLGGTNGLMRLNRSGLTSFRSSDGLGDQYTVLVSQTRDGQLFTVGNNFSLSLFDGHGFQTIKPALPSGPQFLWSSNPAFQDSRGEWWFLTSEKLYRFAAIRDLHDLAHERPLAIYDRNNGLKGDAMFHIFEDSRGDLWISTKGLDSAGFGLSRWNRSTEKFYSFSPAEGMPPNKSPSSFAEDRSGNLWFGFYQGGMVRYANGRFTEFTTADGLPKGLVTALYSDRQGRLWIGSSLDGLSRIDDPTADHPRFTRLTSTDGLASNNVRSISGDLIGNVYVGTARGVDRLGPDTTRIRHYSINDGLAGDFVATAVCDRSGAMWFGTPSGLSRLAPVADKTLAPPPVWISGLRIAGESRSVPELGTAAISNLELAPAQNNLQIDFLAIDINQGEELRYQYMLEGADKDWSAPTPLRTVNYANLDSGSYRFMVRAARPNGVASAQTAMVSFRVLAPVWRRWWFITMGAVFIIGAGVMADRYRVARVLEREQGEAALRRSREERLEELERVRKRIASDLHDDIGSSLTQISLLSEVVNQRIDRRNLLVTEPLAMIANSSRELIDAMSDIVWAINPLKDHLSDLTQRMRSLASDVFTVCGIKFHFRAPPTEVDLPLGANLRREVFLIFKESVNNIVKHSGATEVEIEFRVDREQLFLRALDNGAGFEAGRENEGHGLISMHARVKDIGGKLEIVSPAGQGTTVTLWVSLRDQGGRSGSV